jgi:NodT family efflux transporter outer membrane factor (OMF) lipoprotein
VRSNLLLQKSARLSFRLVRNLSERKDSRRALLAGMTTLSVLIIAAMVLASCTVGPDYVKPTTEVPPAYKEIQGWKVAEPKAEIARGRWWEIYGDKELNSLEEQVDVSNQNVIMAAAQFRQARAAVQGARSGYFPAVTAGASFVRSRRETGALGSSRQATIASDYLLPVSVAWEPDIWGRVRRSVEANRAAEQASAADLAAVRLSMQTELAQDYFQLRTLDAQKKILEETVISYQQFLELTKNRYASGVASQADMLQAKTQLKTIQTQAIDVGVQRAQFEHAVAALIGKPASVFSVPASPLSSVPPEIPVGVPSELLERRPDVAAAERLVAAANAQIGVAVSAFYPSITLSASGGFEASHLSQWLSWPSRFWSIGSVIAETVFEGGLRRALTDEAQAAYDAEVASYRQTVLTAFQETEDNLAALCILEEEAKTQDEAVKTAQQSVEVVMNQYKAGTASYLNVITAQAAELNNQSTAVSIAGRRMTASVLLIKALGGGWNVSALPKADEPDAKKKQAIGHE